MNVSKAYKVLKLSATGLIALILGVVQVSTGESQGIVAGSGSLIAAAVVFAFIGWVLFRKEDGTRNEGVRPADERAQRRLLWLGILLMLLPGLLYLYLSYSMPQFNMAAVVFLSIPIFIAGLGCLAAGLWPSRAAPSL